MGKVCKQQLSMKCLCPIRLAICDGDDMMEKSIHFTFDFPEMLLSGCMSTAATAKIHVSRYGSLYSDGVLIMAIDRELCCEL